MDFPSSGDLTVLSTNSNSASSGELNQEEGLLADVNAALASIVSESEHQHHEVQRQNQQKIPENVCVEWDRNDSDLATDSVTLSEPQVTALRKLAARIQQHRKQWRKVVTGSEEKRVRDHARDHVKRSSAAVKKRVRKVLTGSEERALRDWVNDAKVVKTVDKFSFVLGVVSMLMTEYVFLQVPEQFGKFFVLLISIMMTLRFYMYSRSRYLYFMIDFCYFANASCFLNILVFPQNARLWRLNYAIGTGTLMGALMAWRNSLVFHSLDKVISIAIHFLPGLLTYSQRWSCPNSVLHKDHMKIGLGWTGTFLDPCLFHLMWQLLYILKTEIIDCRSLEADQSIQTSMRYLTRDTKNPMHVIAKRVCRKMNVMGPTEDFEPEALKTKLIFWIGQLLFILITLIPTHFLFQYQDLNTAYILLVMTAAIFNGSNYYFEVFAARYLQQLEAKATKNQDQAQSTTSVDHVLVGLKDD